MNSSPLQAHLAARKAGALAGIYSVCSAHPWVLRAAVEQAAETGTLLLIEATSNQVNQFGGYTGLRPSDFRDSVIKLAADAGFPAEKLILGGDHLGPNPWRRMRAAEAMGHACAMVADYVQAGFTKIHLDASMPCADDAASLSDEVVAERAAQLCRAAEKARPAGIAPVYVIGTEVPTPGGATHALSTVDVTSVSAAAHTLDVHRRTFDESGLKDVWSRVIAMVVQPGVEFDHDTVVAYDRSKAEALSKWLETRQEDLVFEAHSTDYQLPNAYAELVEDGFAILKVGPALTFAMREAIYALEDIEAQLVQESERSHLSQIVESTMLRVPADWETYYSGTSDEQKMMRLYSYSDRIRYYWHDPEIAAATQRLISNLSSRAVPDSMYSRYLPAQYLRLRSKQLRSDPVAMVVDRVRDVLRTYASACDPASR